MNRQYCGITSDDYRCDDPEVTLAIARALELAQLGRANSTVLKALDTLDAILLDEQDHDSRYCQEELEDSKRAIDNAELAVLFAVEEQLLDGFADEATQT